MLFRLAYVSIYPRAISIPTLKGRRVSTLRGRYRSQLRLQHRRKGKDFLPYFKASVHRLELVDPDVVVLIIFIVVMFLHQDKGLIHILEVNAEVFNQVAEPCGTESVGLQRFLHPSGMKPLSIEHIGIIPSPEMSGRTTHSVVGRKETVHLIVPFPHAGVIAAEHEFRLHPTADEGA